MNRLWIGVAVLAVFLGLGIGSNLYLGKVEAPMTAALEAAAEAALIDPSEAGEQAQRALRLWEESRDLIAAVSPREPVDRAEGLFIQLPLYIRREAWTDLAACCLQLKEVIRSLAETQRCTWQSLL